MFGKVKSWATLPLVHLVWPKYLVRGLTDYLSSGGSTIVVLFEKGMVQWDEDLVINGRASLETLVRVGMGIGHARRSLSMSSKV